MAVAMKDLEIRGSGNLLGGEQSGHIASVGFDLYVRLVGEAVRAFRGDEADEMPADVKVDLPVDAHLPHDYVPGEKLRLEVYRKLAEVHTDEALQAVRAEVLDRYGPLPQPVEHLFAVAAFRLAARERGVSEVVLQGRNIRIGPLSLPESAVMRLQRLYPGATYKSAVSIVSVPRPATARVGGQPLRDVGLLTWCAELIEAVVGPIAEGAAASAGTRG
jgi:transcription-repair coupling factor (superfamily II helicase)